MNKKQILEALAPYPEDWEVFCDCAEITHLEPMEGTTSDGPGSVTFITSDD